MYEGIPPGPLAHWQLETLVEQGVITCTIPDSVQPSSWDLHLAPRLLIPDPHKFSVYPLDLRRPVPTFTYHPFEMQESDQLPFILHRGEFVLGSTIERVRLPVAFQAQVEGRSTWARAGLAIHVAGFIDPGFNGHITLELFNHGPFPLVLWPGASIGQLVIYKLSRPAWCGYGDPMFGSHYQDQAGTAPPVGNRGMSNEQHATP